MPTYSDRYLFPSPSTTDEALVYPALMENAMQLIDNALAAVGNNAADLSSTGQTTNSTTYVDKTDTQAALTVGPSGVVMVILEAFMNGSSGSATSFASVRLSGALTVAASDDFSCRTRTTALVGSSNVKVFTGCTPGATLTATLAMRVGNAAETATVNAARIQLVRLG